MTPVRAFHCLEVDGLNINRYAHGEFQSSTYRDNETLRTGVILPDMWEKVQFLAEVLTSKHSQEHICTSHPEALTPLKWE